MKKAFIYLLFAASALPAGAQTLTLDECRAAAAEHNRTLQNSRYDLEAALQTRREAFTGYFPQVSATGLRPMASSTLSHRTFSSLPSFSYTTPSASMRTTLDFRQNFMPSFS